LLNACLMLISVVTPVYNSSTTINTLVRQIVETVAPLASPFEIIMVDDGSTDDSWDVIESLCIHAPVRGIKLSRNYGQHHAIMAGLAEACGEWIVVMDCDLQDNPVEIARLYRKAMEGYAVVTACRIDRKDPFLKKLFSRMFWKTLSYLTGASIDHKIANFGIYRKDIIQAIIRMNEPVPFFPTMVLWAGFKKTTIDAAHGKRHSGKTGYSYSRMLRLAIDIILANSDKPIRIFIRIGFAISLISFFIGLRYLFLHLTHRIVVPGFTSIIISIWFLGGLTILILGILGLYLGKTFEGVKGRPNYIIEKKTS
jgi:dolichol-phosphate mannosyltransferase